MLRGHLLHDMLQSMGFGLLEIVAAIQRVEPRVKEELGPVSGSNDHAAAGQALSVLSQDKVNAAAFEVGKGADDAVRGHDGLVNDHERLQALGLHNVRLKIEGWVHDQSRRGQVKEEGCVRVQGHGVSEGWDGAP